MKTPEPRLYLVTDTALCDGVEGLVSTVRAAVENGVDIVQLRDHDATTRELIGMGERLIEVARPYGVPVVIDDRLDVALAIGAGGVHLGQSDLDPAVARRLANSAGLSDFHIGWSVTESSQVETARAFEAGTLDLLGVGPYRATPTKPDAASPLGLAGIAEIARSAADFHTVAIGGVKESDIPHLIARGVGGVAVVSAICGQPDPAAATQSLRRHLDTALEM